MFLKQKWGFGGSVFISVLGEQGGLMQDPHEMGRMVLLAGCSPNTIGLGRFLLSLFLNSLLIN